MKRGRFLIACLCMGCMLTGCGNLFFSPEVSGISIEKKGGITEVVREMFDESVYNTEELKQEIESEVKNYNASSGEEKVKQKSLKVKNGVAELKMTYASAKDYAAFNSLNFYSGDIVGAVQAGHMFEGSFRKVTDGNVNKDTTLWGSEIIRGTDYQTVIFKGPLLVQVPGNIVYVSEGVQVTDKDTAVMMDTSQVYVVYQI